MQLKTARLGIYAGFLVAISAVLYPMLNGYERNVLIYVAIGAMVAAIPAFAVFGIVRTRLPVSEVALGRIGVAVGALGAAIACAPTWLSSNETIHNLLLLSEVDFTLLGMLVLSIAASGFLVGWAWGRNALFIPPIVAAVCFFGAYPSSDKSGWGGLFTFILSLVILGCGLASFTFAIFVKKYATKNHQIREAGV